MSDAKKTHTLQLGTAPAEEVTAAQLAAVQAFAGNAFAQYTVTPIAEQVPKPADPLAKGSKALAE